MGIQASLINSIWSTQTKVDDTQLRKRQADMLPRIIEIMAAEERKLPVVRQITREQVIDVAG